MKTKTSFFIVTSSIIESCLIKKIEHPANQEPEIDIKFHNLGRVTLFDNEEEAKNALKMYFLDKTEVDLLAKIYAIESNKLESQKMRLELRVLNKKSENNKHEMERIKFCLSNKKENTLKLRKEIKKLRGYRNHKIEIPQD